MKDIAKVYPQLSADERFRLFMQAVARDDGQEQDRLNNTCPQERYRCDDLGYTRRKMHFFYLALWHYHDLRRVEHAATLALVCALAYDESDEAAEEKVDRVMEAFQKLMRKSASKIEGWKRFCSDIGVPDELPEVLGGGDRVAGPMVITKDIASEIGGCEPDVELIETEMQGLQDYWSNLLTKIN